MSESSSAIESLLKRDRVIVIAALVLITALSWLYLIDMARDMANMDMANMDMANMDMANMDMANMDMGGMDMGSMDMGGEMTMNDMGMDHELHKDMPSRSDIESEAMPMDAVEDDAMNMSDSAMDMPMSDTLDGGMDMSGAMDMTQIIQWTPGYFTMMFLMWSIMMVGMMVPSAAPMILVYASMVRKRENAAPFFTTGAFTTGYLLAWTLFSLIATLLQWGLDSLALLSPMMVSTSPLLGGGILIATGIYQLTPYKNACLAHCRHPVQYFMQHWRKGRTGALRMGLHHGIFCIGCCWFLMMLLFFGGVMNLLWIAAITLFVLLEKVLPQGGVLGKVVAPVLILLGVGVLFLG